MCPVDGVPLLKCSGHGYCQSPRGTCLCQTGYVGASCNLCAPSHMRYTTNGPCIFLPGSLTSCNDRVQNGNEEGVDCGGPNCGPCIVDSPYNLATTVGASLGSVFVFGLIVGGYTLYRHKSTRARRVVIGDVEVDGYDVPHGDKRTSTGKGTIITVAADPNQRDVVHYSSTVVSPDHAAVVTGTSTASRASPALQHEVNLDLSRPSRNIAFQKPTMV